VVVTFHRERGRDAIEAAARPSRDDRSVRDWPVHGSGRRTSPRIRARTRHVYNAERRIHHRRHTFVLICMDWDIDAGSELAAGASCRCRGCAIGSRLMPPHRDDRNVRTIRRGRCASAIPVSRFERDQVHVRAQRCAYAASSRRRCEIVDPSITTLERQPSVLRVRYARQAAQASPTIRD